MLIRNFMLPCLLSVMFFAPVVNAEQFVTFGEHTVHYNALSTELLEPAIASSYKITRSKNRAFLNISILKNKVGTATQPVKGEVTASAVNLKAQLREIKMREIQDGGAIYYIGELPVTHEETLNFKINVKPEGTAKSTVVSFQQQFFTK